MKEDGHEILIPNGNNIFSGVYGKKLFNVVAVVDFTNSVNRYFGKED